MTTLRVLALCILAAPVLAVDKPEDPIFSRTYEKPYDITTSVRSNGCTLELRRYPDVYTKSKPKLQGFWVQEVFVGEKSLLQIQHSQAAKEQLLTIERNPDYGVVQIDRDLDGKYESFIVASLKHEGLKDVLLLTTNGWLRHSTAEEFKAWQSREEANKRAIEAADKAIRDALKRSTDELKK